MGRLGAAIAPWLEGCRWFGGGPVRVERAIELRGPWQAEALWLVVEAGGVRYNVPVVVDGERVVDATGEASGQRALLALACASEPVAAPGLVCRQAAGALAPMAQARRLSGEQSNTSIIYRLADSSQVIVKIFRVFEPGDNPDVALQRILSDTGTVPRVHGWVRLVGEDVGDGGAAASGDVSDAGAGASGDGGAAGDEASAQLSDGTELNETAAAQGAAPAASERPAADGGAGAQLSDGTELNETAAAPGAGTAAPGAGPQVFDVAIAQEFLPGATDAWRIITSRLARPGLAGATDPPGKAEAGDLRSIARLGELTYRIHRHLAERCPTSAPDAAARHCIAATWSRRAERALAIVPQLEPWRTTIEQTYARALDATWPHLQAIHGDFHLGQVLHVPGRGWVAIDFEGEPLRPLAERSAPDLALRDVAGMLRSFSYAAGSAKLRGADPQAMDAWEGAARSAFLEGYGSPSGNALLEALVLDKALYELTYEAAQRPDWIAIPLLGVTQLLGIGTTQSQRLLSNVDVSRLNTQPMEE